MKASLWIERVPSALNVADLPSREEYGLLAKMNAVRVAPTLDQAFLEPAAWSALSVREVLGKM